MNDDYSQFFPTSGKFSPKQPNSDALIIRFLPLTKAIHLFETCQLHLTRLDKFDDKNEGMWTAADNSQWLKYGPFDVSKFTKNFRSTFAVLCWSIYDEELNQPKMWQEYVSSGQGVAIISRAGKLCEQVNKSLSNTGCANTVLAEVQYVDRGAYSNLVKLEGSDHLPNSTLPYYQKDATYSFEREVRLMVSAGLDANKQQWVISTDGLLLSVEPKQIIEKILLPPSLKVWERDSLSGLLGKYGLKGVIG